MDVVGERAGPSEAGALRGGEFEGGEHVIVREKGGSSI